MGNSSAKYATPHEGGRYTNLTEKQPPAAPSLGRVTVTGGRSTSSTVQYGNDDDDGILHPTSSKASVSSQSDNLDKTKPHRSAITAPDLRRYSSVSSSTAQSRPDEPYEAPPTSAIPESELKRIKRAGGDDDLPDIVDDGNDIDDGHPHRKAGQKRVSFSEDGKDSKLEGSATYTLQTKKPSHHIAMIVRPGSGLIGLQPGSLAINDEKFTPTNVNSRQLQPLPSTSIKYR
ncbi:hypothetical protein H310_01903 [Aphanomyces invadans]|uniref:Uncharacterized protein n=1 Tax=Aphanomyces invadans TaxID=157072 RepID=A0A024UP19_9STRA|nr:hypothetical protein H310_01903 [Aphanomyces invadans]ETW07368.1 hypothetical protein H310_01903 [Aphanomyces invadans]|eukprot:XP_008863461.1 hypothetical protein H310_01903 [Aphanomyces invadans]